MEAEKKTVAKKRSPWSKRREPLTQEQILTLDRALMGVFHSIRAFRESNAVARHIKFPPIPAIFSESIAIAATPILFGPEWTGCYGGRDSDLTVKHCVSGKLLRVEVKATGQHAFQELKEKDLLADALIWIRFGRRYELGGGVIEVAVIEALGRYVKASCRLDVRRWDLIPGLLDSQRVFRFDSLEQMLLPAA